MKSPFGKVSKKGIVFFVAMLTMMFFLASSLPAIAKIAVCILMIFLYFFSRRDEVLFNKGVGFVQQQRIQEAIVCFQKAFKGDLKKDQKLAIASVFIQNGKNEEGMEIIQALLGDELNQNLRMRALALKSIAFWNDGKPKEAIALLEGIVDDGYEDENIMTSLSVYLIVQGRFNDAEKYLPSSSYEDVSTGMLDNYLWLYISVEDWEKAFAVAKELECRTINYPEAFFHLALVRLKQGQAGKAKVYLEKSLSQRFVPNAIISQSFVQRFYRIVCKEPNISLLSKKIDGHYTELARGDVSLLDVLD